MVPWYNPLWCRCTVSTSLDLIPMSLFTECLITSIDGRVHRRRRPLCGDKLQFDKDKNTFKWRRAANLFNACGALIAFFHSFTLFTLSCLRFLGLICCFSLKDLSFVIYLVVFFVFFKETLTRENCHIQGLTTKWTCVVGNWVSVQCIEHQVWRDSD